MRRVTPRKTRSPKAKCLSSPTIFRCPVLGLVAAVFLSGCTVVVGRRPPPPPTPTKVVRPIEVYGTPAPTFAPTPEATPTAAPLPTPSPAPAPTATEPPPTPTATPPPVVIYLVQQGDTLSEIATAYGVPLSAIVEANSITDPGKLTVGEQLVIPSATDATPVAPPAATATLPPAPVAATAASVPTLELIASPTAPPATATATPAPPPLPTAQPQWPQISESSVSINIIEYEKALFPLRPEDVGYPYDGLDNRLSRYVRQTSDDCSRWLAAGMSVNGRYNPFNSHGGSLLLFSVTCMAATNSRELLQPIPTEYRIPTSDR